MAYRSWMDAQLRVKKRCVSRFKKRASIEQKKRIEPTLDFLERMRVSDDRFLEWDERYGFHYDMDSFANFIVSFMVSSVSRGCPIIKKPLTLSPALTDQPITSFICLMEIFFFSSSNMFWFPLSIP